MEKEKQLLHLDYTLQTPEQRNELVKKICAEAAPQKLTPRYLEILANYIVFAMDKQEKKEKMINTDNRMVTINKRETSFQGLVMKFQNGEDGIYNMITNDKNIIFTPKISITQQDVAEIPALKQLRDAIAAVEQAEKTARGKKKYLLKKQLIEMRQDQYVIKGSYKQPIYCLNAIKSFHSIDLTQKIQIISNNENTEKYLIDHTLISFFNPVHLSALLCNYSRLKEQCWSKFESDAYYMMEDLDNLIERTLKDQYPLLYDLLIYKIDGKQNLEIQQLLYADHGVFHSIEYISSLWRNKIPKLLAAEAEKEYLIWYYTEKERGKWKRCSRCGQIKLADNRFFSKNKTSKDGFYSICKECRNKKNKG